MDGIIRVFPRKAQWVPDDKLAFVGRPGLIIPQGDWQVQISCTFTWDIPECERLAKAWGRYYPVKIGGPAYDDPGGEFIPGMFVKYGYVMTSRGCPHKCEFCLVPKREGKLRELEIKDGWNIEDSNVLACSRKHVEGVIEMLSRQSEPARFTGGLEAALITQWFCKLLKQIRVQKVYTAYDRVSQQKAVKRGVKMMLEYGIPAGKIRCYVMIGFPGDTLEHAEERLRWAFCVGTTPFAMYFRPASLRKWEIPPGPWKALVKDWIFDRCIFARMKREGVERDV